MRKNSPIEIQEIGGDRYPDLDTAWRLAMPMMAKDLAKILQELLEAGELVVVDGKIVINTEKEAENQDVEPYSTTFDPGGRLDSLGVSARFRRRRSRAERPSATD